MQLCSSLLREVREHGGALDVPVVSIMVAVRDSTLCEGCKRCLLLKHEEDTLYIKGGNCTVNNSSSCATVNQLTVEAERLPDATRVCVCTCQNHKHNATKGTAVRPCS
jgi:hypothetical protein